MFIKLIALLQIIPLQNSSCSQKILKLEFQWLQNLNLPCTVVENRRQGSMCLSFGMAAVVLILKLTEKCIRKK